MRLLVARCSVDYEGRLAAHLPPAVRLVMVKADGCVAVHADGGAYKPLNWMNAPNVLSEEVWEGAVPEGEGDEAVWVVTNKKGERLVIRLHEVLSDVTHEMGHDPGLEKDGVEAHLQELLAASPDVLGAGLELVRREYPTDIGPVDLLLTDAEGNKIAVEVKRRGEIASVEQLTRYLERLNHDSMLAPVSGLLAAEEIKPQAKVLAESRAIAWAEIDYDELRGVETPQTRLF